MAENGNESEATHMVHIDDSQTWVESKRYTVYKLVVKNAEICYFVFHRYNDFYQLYEKLKREFPDAGLKLPGKRLIGNNFDPEFIKARQEGLNEFISKVCSSPKLFTHSSVKEFLAIDDPRRTVKIYTHEKMDDHKLDGDVNEGNRMDLGATESEVAKVTDFELLTVIGKGSFGKVLLAKKKTENKYYALKVLEKAIIMKRNEVKHIMAERNVLIRNLKHPFLVGLHYSFQTGKKLYFVLDYVNGGELFFHLQRERTFEESRAKFYSAEITSAIGYLHDIKIIYRDLKPENILLDKDGHIKLTDFGLCKEGVAQGDTTSTFCGTPEYLAPEVLKKQDYSNSVDWWCVGVVLYEMMYGLPPFYSRNITEMYEAILYKPLHLKSTVSSSARSILEALLQKDRRFRLGSGKGDAKELYQHPFFNSISWDDLFNKRIEPPFKPKLNGDLDLQNFDPEFTSEAVPIATPGDSVMVSMSKDTNFAGFSYIGDSSPFM
ncbi:Serine/threonine-protein kinase Sgk1-like [Oopsacas minuta]|uniref:Serine/threonine-protein kinase Sgk1-like n=1 Tax=Oopsacas minuta TaxID=111878 RepID=A0AAV7K0E3_9METZ|nr:Serine/threonine-protein kinase Sgk1-like [Oopsacas minuta]